MYSPKANCFSVVRRLTRAETQIKIGLRPSVIYREWQNTSKIRSNIKLGAFVVMPNHMHIIFMIIENRGRMANGGVTNISKNMGVSQGMDVSCGRVKSRCKGVLQYAPTPHNPSSQNTPPHNSIDQSLIITVEPLHSPSQTVGAVIRGFKGAVTKQINELRCAPGSPVWQRGYYEHIIRNQDEFHRIRQYIIKNSVNWAKDIEHPVNSGASKEIPDDIWKET